MHKESQNIAQVGLAHPSHLFNGRQAATHGPSIPFPEIPLGCGLAPGHNQKLRNTSLIAQAREVCRLSSLTSAKRWACLAGTFSIPESPSCPVALSVSSPCA